MATAVPPAKRPRHCLTSSQKRDLCLYKRAHPKATYDNIQAHFLGEWGFKIGRSTIGEVWGSHKKWLEKEKADKQCRVHVPKHKDVDDARGYGLVQPVLMH